MTTQPSTSREVDAYSEKIHVLIAEIENAISEIPGVTQVELVDHQGARAFWGFDYQGLPCSLTWNITP